ncbi:hypothetical protein GGE59_006098 [Rhizobium leguminosarum]|nr:hypothetical protein [Rhizobium esperanzae]MBB4545456.1 hypothetical protein [Rhizobium leguminosarum]MBB5655733.1 hypothetical protein [Rhizobium leguminosarum]
MILLEIDAGGIVAVELECNAPGSVDMNGVPGGMMTLQAMEVEPREVHVIRLFGLFQAVEPDQNALLQLGIDLCSFACLKKICQSFVSERLDHDRFVNF